ncbi:MAG: DUF2600 family protein [Candidatus Eremiobacteraeota bacterium]|nr:DUF2600 family protein [Candidatus Eremiobacteraeota bacterium]
MGSDLAQTFRLVVGNPLRLARLLGLGGSGLFAMSRFLLSVVPRASRHLRAIELRAAEIPDAELRAQALASIRLKAYHVQGGSILATFLKREAADRYVEIVAPLETIYDYLDNLCDRLPGVPEHAYATLHEALLDAVEPARPLHDYYRDGPHRDDGGYLRGLVEESRRGIATLPSLAAVQPRLREAACASWYARNAERFPGLSWWEFAAACGSSLPVFAMVYLATSPNLDASDVDATFDAYFPNISAVHILLDYFIDQAEDREHSELNFVACYSGTAAAVEGVRALLETTMHRIRSLERADPHEFLLRAMCLFYLSHPKVFEQRLDRESAALLAALS